MRHVALAKLVWMVSLALPAAIVAIPGDAGACGAAVYLARAKRPIEQDLPKPVEVLHPVEAKPVEVETSKPSEIIPPFPSSKPKPAEIIPPFPSSKPKPRPQPVVGKPALVADAEEAFSDGKVVRAAARAAAAFPALRKIAPGSEVLSDRALRIVAVAAVRTDGRLELGGLTGKTARDRAANLEWAADVLTALNARRTNNPAFQTDLGEALAKLPARRAEAEKLLGDLADRDLVTSAEGYAALARLRAGNADETAREALRRRCEVMTRTPAICGAPDAGAAGRS